MDYGKLAYLRADEIEAKLTRLSSRAANATCVYRLSALGEGSHILLSRKAGDCSTVTVKARYRGKGRMILSAGALTAAVEDVDGSGDKLLFASGGGDVAVRLIPAAGADLTADFEVVAPLGCESGESETETRIAHVGEVYALCEVRGGYVTAIKTDAKLTFAEEKRIARGAYCDICAADGGFALLFEDGFGMLFCAELDVDLNTVRFSPLGKADGRASVTYRGGRLCVIKAVGGKIEYFTSPYPNAVRGATIGTAENVYAQRVCAVKDCDPIAFLAQSRDALYLIKEQSGASVAAQIDIELDGGVIYA